jgi:hypothetical protein
MSFSVVIGIATSNHKAILSDTWGQVNLACDRMRGQFLSGAGSESYFDEDQAQRNLQVAQQIMGQQHYRAPWGDDTQLRQFRSEIESAISEGHERFRLTRAEAADGRPARSGLFARLFRRT